MAWALVMGCVILVFGGWGGLRGKGCQSTDMVNAKGLERNQSPQRHRRRVGLREWGSGRGKCTENLEEVFGIE